MPHSATRPRKTSSAPAQRKSASANSILLLSAIWATVLAIIFIANRQADILQFGNAVASFSDKFSGFSIIALRVMYMVRGERAKTVPLAFLESAVWVFAISRIFKQVDNPLNMLAFAGGYAAGTMVGMTLERWIASGYILVRVISEKAAKAQLVEAIRGAGFGVTVMPGEGRGGEQAILFVVALRRRGRELLDLIRRSDDDAFVTVDAVNKAIGGYLPPAGAAAGLRK